MASIQSFTFRLTTACHECLAEEQSAENITFILDGNGEFSQTMGMLVDKNDLGFGKRSWRYSMLVKMELLKKYSTRRSLRATLLRSAMPTPCSTT